MTKFDVPVLAGGPRRSGAQKRRARGRRASSATCKHRMLRGMAYVSDNDPMPRPEPLMRVCGMRLVARHGYLSCPCGHGDVDGPR